MTRDELERAAAAGEEAAQLALADALDAEGRHTDAVDQLARAAKAGSAAAKGRIGARILVGDRAPAFPDQGAGLIAEGAGEGDAPAAALLAALTAAGAYRRQSWSEALDWLARAAEGGLAHARGQLAALASDRALAAEAAAGDPPLDLWRRLCASVDVAALTAAPEGETVSADPLIRRFEGFAAPEICDWLIERARSGLKRATVYTGKAITGEVGETRTNSNCVFSLAETDLVQLIVQARMATASSLAFANMEATSVLHYSVGEQFTEHYDFVDPQTADYERQVARYGERVVTFLVYLNDDYEGGETAFPRLGIEHKGERGEGLFFANASASGAPDVRTLHAGRPPTRGEKWVASQFIRNRSIVPGVGAG